MPERSHTVAFRPRARLVSILGEHLISDQAVGLVELVKNAYDADAAEAVVELENLADPERASIAVTDNGVGMMLDDLVTKWLSPAVDHKDRKKHQGERTVRGRLPIGEKGVGRFAVHHLGRRLSMVTRAAGSDELLLEIDWDRFDASETFLDGLALTVVERPPQVFQGDRTGTRLEITRLRVPWNEKLARKVHRTLRRLQSPLRENAADFRVRLVCPEFPELQDTDPTDILARAHYEFRAVIDPNGECDYEYICQHPAVAPRTRSGTDTLGFGDDRVSRSAECGPFWLNLYVWDRTGDYLHRAGISRSELDAHSGVSLFRDGLQVLPYGEPGDDWLLLDQERVQAPAKRISNNQVIGLVSVDQATSLQLRDKTDRQGLVENQAFQDLRTLVRAAIRLFTTHWLADRPPREERRRDGAPAGDIDAARALASAIGKTARDDVRVRRPPSPATGNQDRPDPLGSGGHGETITQRQAVEELVTELDGVSATLREEQRQQDIMRQLAATGLAAERVVHEFGRQVAAATLHLEQLERLPRTDAAASGPLSTIAACLRTLRSEFRVLAPYETAGRADRMRPTSILDAVNLALLLNKHLLASADVEASICGDDFEVRSRPAAIVQIVDNLIHNASYWLSLGGNEDRRLAVVLRAEAGQLLVTDSGPGIHPEIRDQLFQPFTTLKVEGTGLGLFISAELADSLGCTLRLAYLDERRPDFGGAAFVLEFPGWEHRGRENSGG
jgi:C4-dicarboxylate-specific signal transduction histidine kinase